MKKVLLATALSFCVSSAFAAETAVLKVTGTLTNSACTPELSNGGVVDYGNIHLGELSSTSVNQLGQKNIELTITCGAATKVGFSTIDDRKESQADIAVENSTYTNQTSTTDSYLFGLGQTTGGVNIGAYTVFLNLDQVTADGNAVDSIYEQNQDGKWTSTTERNTFQDDNIRIMTVAEKGSLEPLAFTTAVFPLTTSVAIQDTGTLAITDDTPLDGQITISLNYL